MTTVQVIKAKETSHKPHKDRPAEIIIINQTDARKKIFLEEFEKCFGIVTIACANAGIGRRTYYDWLQSDKKFAKDVGKIDIIQVGMVKDKLLKAIIADDAASIRFYLSAKSHEFRHKTEVSSEDQEKVDAMLDKFSKYLDAQRTHNKPAIQR